MYKNERRKYVRLDKIYPVELQVLNNEYQPASDLLQGFTRDVSFEGLCVEINDFHEHYIELLQKENYRLAVFLNIPLRRSPVKAFARLAWTKKIARPYPRRYLLGLSYYAIDKTEQKKIIDYARLSKSFPRVIVLFCVILVLICLSLLLENYALTQSNRFLAVRMARLSDEQSDVFAKLDKLQTERTLVSGMLKKMLDTKKKVQDKLMEVERLSAGGEPSAGIETADALNREKSGLEKELASLVEEMTQIKERLRQVDLREARLKSKLTEINGEKDMLRDKSLVLMQQWLLNAQNGRTGLVVSYDNDPGLMDVGFTYDQALSAFNFIYLGEYERAKKIFDFFMNKAERVKRGFANAYDVETGKVSEYIVHSGPPVYLGLAVLKYEDQTGDKKYRKLAVDIADWLISVMKNSKNSALPGGPGLDWTSTEQNISACVFFGRMFEKTGDQRYDIAAKDIFSWLKKDAYNKKLKRFNRGENDNMIATDTVALSILAFGPERLKEIGVSVEDLVSCIEDNCKTDSYFHNNEGKRVRVNGYDFCAPSSIGRKGTISVEWTAQMVVAYYELARFYRRENDAKKAADYKRLADHYISELEKIILMRNTFGRKSSAGLPYAPDSGFDTGHGWFTPGSDSISAAGTNFAIFAKEKYNIYKR